MNTTSATSAVDCTKASMFYCLKQADMTILGLLWDAGEPQTARQVFEQLQRGVPWKLSTVRRVMWRMAGQNVLKSRRRARTLLYAPAFDREAVAAACVEAVVSEILGGKLRDSVAAVLQHLPLSRSELRGIRGSL